MTPPPRVHLDIETRARVDLRKFGVYAYAACPDFKVLMGGFNTGGQTWAIDTTDEVLDAFTFFWDEGYEIVAMNAQFERIAFSAALGLGVGKYLDPERFHDPRAVAAQKGWPQGLENCAKSLAVTEKDSAGKELIRYWTRPISNGKRKGEFRSPSDDPVKWQQFVDYMITDVDSLVAVDRVLGDHVTPTERAVFMTDQRINDRGMAIDLELAATAKVAADLNAELQKERVRELTLWDVENPGAPGQMREWLLKQNGIDEEILPDMKAETVETLMESPFLEGHVREVLELRQELALAAPAKFSTALTMQGEGRLRGTLQYGGAHTLRWAGKGTQPQNLPKATFEDKIIEDEDLRLAAALLEQDMTIAEVKAGEPVSSEDLKKLVRPMFLGPMTVVDYRAIEAMVLAWLSGEQWVLQAFRENRDLYTETAARMGPTLTRQHGKVTVLACGYGGSAGAMRNMLPPNDPMNDLSDDVLREDYVYPWRKANSHTVRLWGALERGFGESGKIGPHLRSTHHREPLGGVSTRLHLPSGRYIEYHSIMHERYTIIEKKTKKRIRKVGWRYMNPQIPFSKNARIGTYGGSLAENVTQAVSRDILAEALVRLEHAGYTIIAHVHDEVLIEGYHDVDVIKKIMCELPDWAAGMELDGAGFQTQRYRKG